MGSRREGRSTVEMKDDAVLVAMARTGDSEAFGELVRRHRGMAYGWAKSIVNDPHLADDVVQEAIIKSFVHLGTLADMRLFLPWLQRIVRNQALRSVRRGGRFAKELPVSHFAPVEQDDPAWPAMTPSSMASRREEDPCELVLHREVMDTIVAMIQRLSPAERKIFEAHVLKELTAQEIAGLFQVSTASVYMSLSRSRKKMLSVHRAHPEPKEGKELSMHSAKRTVLSKPAILHSRTGLYNESIRNCIYYALPYVGKGHLGYDEAMALTGHAFQINIERRTIDICGVYMYAGTTMFPNSLLNLGLNSSLIDKFGYEKMPEGTVKENLYHMTLDMIRDTIDRGVPAIFSGGINTQFALYYGYDDQRETLYAIDTLTQMEIPYSSFRNRHLYGFVIEEPAGIEGPEAIRRMLTMAVRHARGQEATFTGLVNGLSAYDAWIRAFENRSVDAIGNAASMRNVGDMRSYAASFLRKQRIGWESLSPYDGRMLSLLSEAAGHYGIVTDVFRQLQAMFPYPGGADPNNNAAAAAAIQLLAQAREAEEAGTAALESLLEHLHGKRPAPRLIEPIPLWVL